MSGEKKRNLIAFLLFGGIFVSVFFIHGGAIQFMTLTGILVVVGGTAGALLVAYRPDQLAIVWKVLVGAYRTDPKKPEEIVKILVDLSVKSRVEGILSLEEDEENASILFLREALGVLVDGYPSDRMREILETEMFFFKERREEGERVLRTAANLAPAFGLVGTVVGLISMLNGIHGSGSIIASVPIALTSTLYGVILANFCFTPFAVKLRARTRSELLLQQIITEAVVLIQAELPPRILERQLKAFLTPALRTLERVSYRKLVERFVWEPGSSVNEEKSSEVEREQGSAADDVSTGTASWPAEGTAPP
jgi:chemotaxis protein MotA